MTNIIKLSAVSVASALLLSGATALAAPTNSHGHPQNNDNGNSNPHNNITICHATGSMTNPYVVITPNANGVASGHYPHQDSRDIIPAFDYNEKGSMTHFGGQNWDSASQAIYNNGCKPGTGGSGGEGGSDNGGGGNSGSGGGVVQGAATVVATANNTTVAPSNQVTTMPQGAVSAGGGAKTTSIAALTGLLASVASIGAGLRLRLFDRQ